MEGRGTTCSNGEWLVHVGCVVVCAGVDQQRDTGVNVEPMRVVPCVMEVR